ncbi:hypothetical protein KAU32_02715 [bacterium]|nr:hypothetical protein [bacterium]
MSKKKNGFDLNLLKDVPAFHGADNETDPFDHEAIASTLKSIILDNSNNAPFVIGLLGPWGSGKSSVINKFKQYAKQEDSFGRQFTLSYFNAWKYADDCFRRQFLIQAANDILKGKKREQYTKQLNLRFIRELEKEFHLTDSFETIKSSTKSLVAFIAVVFIAVCIALIPGFMIYGFINKSFWALMLSFLPLLSGSFVLNTLIGKIFPKLFELKVDPQIILPEHFEEEFIRIIEDTGSDSEKYIFVIDDIDRCSHEMILNVLDSIKTFLASNDSDLETYKRCFFIITMDGHAVADILSKERSGKYDNIQELTKFFDVFLRMNVITNSDLIDYGREISTKIGLPEEVMNIAYYGGFDTPRKLKHYLNNIKTTLFMLTEREEQQVFAHDPFEIVDEIAKLKVIEFVFPTFYQEIIDEHTIMENYQARAIKSKGFLGGKFTKTERSFNKFLWETRTINVKDLNSLIFQKYPKYALMIPDYTNLLEAIRSYSIEVLKLLDIKNIPILRSILNVFQDQFYKKPVGTLLLNLLQSAIYVYKEQVSDYSLKKMYSKLIVSSILESDKIFEFMIKDIISLAENSENQNFLEEYLNKGISLITPDIFPETIAEFLSLFYSNHAMHFRKSVATRIDETLVLIDDNEWLMDVLVGTEINANEKWIESKHRIFDQDMIVRCIKEYLKTDSTPMKNFRKRVIVMKKYWDDSIEQAVISQMALAFQYWSAKQNTEPNENINNYFTLIGAFSFNSHKEFSNISENLQKIYNKFKEIDRNIIIIPFLIACYYSSDNDRRYDDSGNLISLSSNETFEESIRFILNMQKIKEDSWWDRLNSSMVKYTVNRFIANINNDTFTHKIDTLITNHFPFSDQQKQAIINASINLSFNKIMELELILNDLIDNEQMYNWYKSKVYSIVNSISQTEPQKVNHFLGLLSKKSKLFGDETVVADYIFNLSTHSNIYLRKAGGKALSFIQNILGEALFKTKINIKIQEVFTKPAREIILYVETTDAFLEYQSLFEPEINGLLLSALEGLISINDGTYIKSVQAILDSIQKKYFGQRQRIRLKELPKLINDNVRRKDLQNFLEKTYKFKYRRKKAKSDENQAKG